MRMEVYEVEMKNGGISDYVVAVLFHDIPKGVTHSSRIWKRNRDIIDTFFSLKEILLVKRLYLGSSLYADSFLGNQNCL